MSQLPDKKRMCLFYNDSYCIASYKSNKKEFIYMQHFLYETQLCHRDISDTFSFMYLQMFLLPFYFSIF